MASGDSQAISSAFPRRDLRQATLVIPETGERLKRQVTLRDPRLFGDATGEAPATSNERTPLLASTKPNEPPITWSRRLYGLFPAIGRWLWDFIVSRNGQGVLKCSIAYLLATMAVFVSFFTKLLGSGDGKHLVANIVVWFHPARATGSMDQGSLYAWIAFTYGALVCYASMTTVVLSRSYDLIEIGHAIVLVAGIGAGLGYIAWVKQRYHDLLINVSCTLASIPITTVLTRDRSIQDGYYSHNAISQTLRMIIMAILISILVNLLIRPIFAQSDLRENLTKSTHAFADMLAGIAAGFLSGSENDLKHPAVTAASDNFNLAYMPLDQNLAEAKYERYICGTERQYRIESRLVKSVQRLAQDIGGLRSAASIEFVLLAESAAKGQQTVPLALDAGSSTRPDLPSTSAAGIAGLPEQAIDDSHDVFSDASSTPSPIEPTGPLERGASMSLPSGPSAASAALIFATFIEHLGPPMKSLAFTLKQILTDVPFGPAPKFNVSLNPNFKSSLNSAIQLFSKSRKEALELVYKTKAISQAQSVEVAANFEDVAASCGHFSSSLQDLAENCVAYLETLEDLDHEIHDRSHGRSWNWLLFWRTSPGEDVEVAGTNRASEFEHRDSNFPVDMPSLGARRQAQKQTGQLDSLASSNFRYRLWRTCRVFRRDDIKFAFKVGIGAVALGVLAYIPATQPFFYRWRLEWALATYMFVCAMTIGAANTTVFPRLKGTAIGAILAIIVWIMCRGNAIALAFCGWLVSLFGFYLMLVLDQGPMSRFIMLTYNLSVLYSYSLSINDQDDKVDWDEGGIDPQIYEIVFHRVTAVTVGILWGLFITQAIWPISARRKLRSGLSLLWLRMGLIWKRSPLSILLPPDGSIDDRIDGHKTVPSYMDVREEFKLRQFNDFLDSLRKAAESEFMLRGVFPTDDYSALLKSTTRMLDGFHALNSVIAKDLKATPGEAEILEFTKNERESLARRISHLFSVLASSVKLEYPIDESVPEIDHARDRLLAKVYHYRQDVAPQSRKATDEDYELLYAYALVTAQIAKEIESSGKVIEKLYGTLSEDLLQLQ